MTPKDNNIQTAMQMPDITSLSAGHWTSTKFSSHIMADSLIKHVLGLTYFGMADIGEVLEVVSQLKDTSDEAWISAWGDMAKGIQERAEKALAKGKLVSASTAYLRASTYWRVSLMIFSEPKDPRMRDYAYASVNCYAKYLELSGYPGEYVKIPYEGSFLPGHFYRSPVAGNKAPLLIITPGRDTFAEDTRFIYDAAIRRGIHCLIYDGPGQGFALRLNNIVFRPDWENVVTPVIDFALEKIPGIDPSRIGLMGLSMGGYLVPRAAAFEKRIKICIADTGNLNWGEAIIPRMQMVADMDPEDIPPQILDMMTGLVKDYAWKHGVPNTIPDVINVLKQYDNTSIVDKITCQMLVLDGAEEINVGKAKKFYDALTCPKDYMLFDQTTTAQLHCQMGSYATATEYIFDWLDERL